MSKKVKLLCVSGLLIVLLCIVFLFFIKDTFESDFYCIIDNNDIILRTQLVNGKRYLFLPSSIDCSSIKMHSKGNVKILGRYLIDVLDLYSIFGEITPCKEYKLTLEYNYGLFNCFKNTETVYIVKSSNVSSLHFELDSSIEQINGSKENKTSGKMLKINVDSSSLYEEIDKFTGRGNTTWGASEGKKPYNFKLSNKQKLLNNSSEAKNWCLISNNVTQTIEGISFDRTGLANQTALDLYDTIGGESAIHWENVDLFINGEYRGSYLLTDKVEISDGRIELSKTKYNAKGSNTVCVIQPEGIGGKELNMIPEGWNSKAAPISKAEAKSDIAISSGIQAYQYVSDSVCTKPGGYIIELDKCAFNEESWFVTKRGAQIAIKEPECPTKDQVVKIATFFQQFEDALFSKSGINHLGKSFKDYVDIESLAKKYIVDCFTCQVDMLYSSCFFYIDCDSNGNLIDKLISGPAWDYDFSQMSFDRLFFFTRLNNYNGTVYSDSRIYTDVLLEKGEFVSLLYELSSEKLKSAWNNLINEKIDGYIDSVSASQYMNEIMWKNDFEKGAAEFKDNISLRYERWFGKYFSEDKLLGVTVSLENDSIISDVKGRCYEYHWYIVKSDGAMELLSDCNDSEMKPKGSGKYILAVTGKNPCFNTKSNRELINNEMITMYSNELIVK